MSPQEPPKPTIYIVDVQGREMGEWTRYFTDFDEAARYVEHVQEERDLIAAIRKPEVIWNNIVRCKK